jgi:hypothetical protein
LSNQNPVWQDTFRGGNRESSLNLFRRVP